MNKEEVQLLGFEIAYAKTLIKINGSIKCFAENGDFAKAELCRRSGSPLLRLKFKRPCYSRSCRKKSLIASL